MEFNIKVNHAPRDYYKNGLSFMKAAWRCYGKEKDGEYKSIDGGGICQLTAPTVVNAAFACEMFLKALLVRFEIPYGKEHNLVKLYDKLSDELKEKISLFCGDKEDIAVFRNTLSKYADGFVDIRYYVENEGWVGMDPTYMISLAHNLSEITKYLLCNSE